MRSAQNTNEPRNRTRTRGGRKNREKQLQEQSCKKEGMLFANLDPVPCDKKIDAPPGACLNCRSFKHKHKDCNNPKTHEYCCNCGRRGVAVNECPRCARSFHAQDYIMRSWIYDRFFDDETSCETQVLVKKESGLSVGEYGNRRLETVYVESHDSESMENLDESRMDSVDENPIAPTKKGEPRKENPLHDYLRLFGAMKHLPVEAQNDVALQFMAEKKKIEDRVIDNYLHLLGAMKHLSIDAQNVIVVQFVAERKRKTEEVEVQLRRGSETS